MQLLGGVHIPQRDSSEGPTSRTLDRRGLADQVYEIVKARIMDLELGPGSRLNMDQVARAIGVSAIPVREAMARLAAEGLLRGEAYRGYTVRPRLEPQELRQLFAARRLIEGQAAAEGAARHDPRVVAELEHLETVMAAHPARGRYLDHRAHSAADGAFHRTIVASAANPWLVDMYGALHAHLHLSRLYPLLDDAERDVAGAATEHARIVAAYRSASDADARGAVLDHLIRSEARLAPYADHGASG